MYFDICLKNIRQAFCANTFQQKLFAKNLFIRTINKILRLK